MNAMRNVKEAQPFKGATIAACLHLEAKTANLLLTLSHLGATVAACGSNPLSTQDDICAALANTGDLRSVHGSSVPHREADRGGLTGDDRRLDRKSTRLNSSHCSISYAVFCLKKKRAHV